jgi:hypothetical protein
MRTLLARNTCNRAGRVSAVHVISREQNRPKIRFRHRHRVGTIITFNEEAKNLRMEELCMPFAEIRQADELSFIGKTKLVVQVLSTNTSGVEV